MTEAVFFSSWQSPCKFIKLIEVGGGRVSAVVEFYFVKTTFMFGVNILVAVPTTLRSVWFASYPSSKGWFSLATESESKS